MERKKNVLIYGFSGFSFIKKNPSARVIKELKRTKAPHIKMTASVLPVSYREVKQKLKTLMKHKQYDLILGFGVAPRAKGFRLERMAYNVIHSKTPDVSGKTFQKKRIIPGAKKMYKTTAKVYALQNRLQEVQLPVTVSNNPGAYVCNYAYYLSHYFSQRYHRKASIGFVHFPLDKQTVKKLKLNCSSLSMSSIIRGAKIILKQSVENT